MQSPFACHRLWAGWTIARLPGFRRLVGRERYKRPLQLQVGARSSRRLGPGVSRFGGEGAAHGRVRRGVRGRCLGAPAETYVPQRLRELLAGEASTIRSYANAGGRVA